MDTTPDFLVRCGFFRKKLIPHCKARMQALEYELADEREGYTMQKLEDIKLIVMPVPPKCAVVPFEGLKPGDAMMYLKPFYEKLRTKGIEVLDLYEVFAASKEPVYCKQDAHWNQRASSSP